MYIFHNAIERTKHGDIEKIKVIRCKSYILREKKHKTKQKKRKKKNIQKKKNQDFPITRGSRFKDQ
jgi:hypothetical protein